jgi:hypothetical protein
MLACHQHGVPGAPTINWLIGIESIIHPEKVPLLLNAHRPDPLRPLPNNEAGPMAAIADRASEFVHNSNAENTIRAYRSDWTNLEDWCEAHAKHRSPPRPRRWG